MNPDAVIPKPLAGSLARMAARDRREASNESFHHSADKGTHLNVVVAAAGIAVVGFSFRRRSRIGSVSTQTAGAVKVGNPTAISSSIISYLGGLRRGDKMREEITSYAFLAVAIAGVVLLETDLIALAFT